MHAGPKGAIFPTNFLWMTLMVVVSSHPSRLQLATVLSRKDSPLRCLRACPRDKTFRNLASQGIQRPPGQTRLWLTRNGMAVGILARPRVGHHAREIGHSSRRAAGWPKAGTLTGLRFQGSIFPANILGFRLRDCDTIYLSLHCTLSRRARRPLMGLQFSSRKIPTSRSVVLRSGCFCSNTECLRCRLGLPGCHCTAGSRAPISNPEC